MVDGRVEPCVVQSVVEMVSDDADIVFVLAGILFVVVEYSIVD